jgi:hypothetical protein
MYRVEESPTNSYDIYSMGTGAFRGRLYTLWTNELVVEARDALLK